MNVFQTLIESGSEEAAVPDIEVEMKVKKALKATFRPEFLNRIDETVIFHQLTREHLTEIAEIQVKYLRDRLASRGMALAPTEATKERLAKDGFDRAFGARPLKRLTQQQIENPLVMRILSGDLSDSDHIVVDGTGEGFSFEGDNAPVGV